MTRPKPPEVVWCVLDPARFIVFGQRATRSRALKWLDRPGYFLAQYRLVKPKRRRKAKRC